jgi:hypothetical protein
MLNLCQAPNEMLNVGVLKPALSEGRAMVERYPDPEKDAPVLVEVFRVLVLNVV